jgi:DnaK suppressor protein
MRIKDQINITPYKQEDIMNKEKIVYIRHVMVQKMRNLRESADNTIAKLKNAEDKFTDPFDQAAVETAKVVELDCRDKDLNLLLDIKETILRIDRGLFGICDHCGRPISQKRLMAAPMSKLCVLCQEKIESARVKSNRKCQYKRKISYDHA